jgi:hypothetical protein
VLVGIGMQGSAPNPWSHAQRYIWAQSLALPLGSTPGQDVLIQDKHGLFADLANKEL